MPLRPASDPPAGFMVLHGNRLEDLRDLLVSVLKSSPPAPLQAETILIQSNGMKHWLELALADDSALGICAATRLELPSSFLWQAYRAVLGAARIPQQMPFDKGALVWRLVRLLPGLVAGDPVYAPLRRYLEQEDAGRRLHQLALQLADVFDGYQSYRADWLDDWSRGADGRDLLRSQDGQALPLPAAHAWQARLWRDLRQDIGPELAGLSRAAVHADFLDALEQLGGRRPPGLPPRIVVFGISSLPMQAVEALAALGRCCQVLMLVQNPCHHFWGDIVEGHEQLRREHLGRRLGQRHQPRPVPQDAAAAGHPLLASWGKQGRDYLHLLDRFDEVERYRHQFQRVDCFVNPLADEKPSRLRLLQAAILELEPDGGKGAAADDSILCVSAHSAQREVEVLHDQLLGWFDADTGLRPADVMVMVPDMADFAPHLQAVFGRFAPGELRHIPYSLADTTARQSPLVQALEQLLGLPDARVSLADWLGLFELPAVRKRFGLSEADVGLLHEWLAAAGVRWGLDAAHRQQWGLSGAVDGLDQNTWSFGLRRLLLGYAVGTGEPWAGTLPQAGPGSLDSRVLGGLLAWFATTERTHAALAQPRTPVQWHATLGELVGDFFQGSDAAEQRAVQRLLEPLESWLERCEQAGLDAELPLEVVREHWLAQLDETGLGQRFFGGGVQFGTLMPMRSIPFKVICLLGMNDGAYPRVQAARDFDLMAENWRLGDRSRREDDRYLFLEALLSARDRLYVSWQGKRATDNAEQPPSVLVAQLLDHFEHRLKSPLTLRQHPLQPFSPAYFLRAEQDSASWLRTYDADWAGLHAPAAASDAAGGPEQAPQAERSAEAEDEALPAPTSLRLDDLRQLLRQPVEVFLRTRLQLRLERLDELEQEDEPFELDPLQQFMAGQQLLDEPNPALAIEKLRLAGGLPMAAFGQNLAQRLADKAAVVQERVVQWSVSHPVALEAQAIELELEGLRLSGSLAGLLAPAEPPAPGLPALAGMPLRLLRPRVGAVMEGRQGERSAKGYTLAGLWVEHLAGCASGLELGSALLGLDGVVELPPLPRERARELLQDLVQVWRSAWTQPLPLGCKTAWAWLQAQDGGGSDPHEAARKAFEGSYQRSGELQESAYLQRAFDDYDAIQDDLPDWAQRLYGPLQRHLRLRDGKEERNG